MSSRRAFLISILVVLFAGCGSTASLQPAPTLTPITLPSTVTPTLPNPVLRLPDEPVGFERVKTEFRQPLSSGLSLPDMVENALQSVVEIRTDFSGGTGFIVNDAGLVVTNKHVIQGANSVTLRLFQWRPVCRHSG